MNTLGLTFLNTAVQASYLVLALVLVRLIFRKAPKKLLCALWALVGLRLIHTDICDGSRLQYR